MVHAHGLTAAQARQSCLYEAAERYSLQWHADEELVTARYKDLRSRAVHQDAYHLHSAGQFANRDVWRRTHGAFQWVPEPFDPSAEIPWVKVHRLWGRAARLVPAEMCFLGIPGRFLYADTNGCASGATEADALRNALYELAERDAVALWWYNRARRPAVRVDHPARRIMERAKRKFWMLDLTHDLGIPVVVAVSTDSQGGRIALGSAAGASLEAAAAKAAGEMLMVYSGLRYSAPEQWAQGTNEGTLCRWFRDARVAQRTYLLPARRRRLPAMNGAERRVDGWVKRHTRSDVGAHVIRVIAPGLRHWWARFAPGRLYEIPPAIGWTSRQLSEAELNPEPYLL
jgi:ribosomal protein S12 methylthiotransferase accessory factor